MSLAFAQGTLRRTLLPAVLEFPDTIRKALSQRSSQNRVGHQSTEY